MQPSARQEARVLTHAMTRAPSKLEQMDPLLLQKCMSFRRERGLSPAVYRTLLGPQIQWTLLIESDGRFNRTSHCVARVNVAVSATSMRREIMAFLPAHVEARGDSTVFLQFDCFPDALLSARGSWTVNFGGRSASRSSRPDTYLAGVRHPQAAATRPYPIVSPCGDRTLWVSNLPNI